jgi:hypothetical protein
MMRRAIMTGKKIGTGEYEANARGMVGEDQGRRKGEPEGIRQGADQEAGERTE